MDVRWVGLFHNVGAPVVVLEARVPNHHTVIGTNRTKDVFVSGLPLNIANFALVALDSEVWLWKGGKVFSWLSSDRKKY